MLLPHSTLPQSAYLSEGVANDGDGDDDDDDDDCDCCYDYVFDDDLCECGATSGLDGRC